MKGKNTSFDDLAPQDIVALVANTAIEARKELGEDITIFTGNGSITILIEGYEFVNGNIVKVGNTTEE